MAFQTCASHAGKGQVFTGVLEGDPGAQHEHAQALEHGFQALAGQLQVKLPLVHEHKKQGQHTAFGRTPGAQLSLFGGDGTDVVGELPLEKVPGVLPPYPDQAPGGQGTEHAVLLARVLIQGRLLKKVVPIHLVHIQ